MMSNIDKINIVNYHQLFYRTKTTKILITWSWEDNKSLLVNKTVIELSPTPGDLMLSKLVIDIFRISENIELVERLRCSPKLMIFDTDNFLRSLCDRSQAVDFKFEWFPTELLPLAWLLLLFVVVNDGDGDVGLCSNGRDNDDLFFPLSSCSSIVAGMWLLTLFDVNNVCLSSSPFNCGCWCCGRSSWELGLIGGVPGETMDIGGGGGGEGVGELIDCWVVNAIDSLRGDSGGSDMQIDACCIDNLWRSWVDF
jgi:hypothetical protein